MKTKLTLLLVILTFQFGFSQEPVKVASVSIDSVKTAPLELEKETKANVQAEKDRLKEEKNDIEKEHQKELDKAKKEAKKAEKERKSSEKALKKIEKEKKKLDNATKNVEKTEDKIKKANADLKKERAKYEKNKLKGKLSPNQDINLREKILKKENKINDLQLKLEKDKKDLIKLLK
ncbi:MAG: colicin import membrane protein [Flavobacterium sp.]|jgi:colicin import membrane protein